MIVDNPSFKHPIEIDVITMTTGPGESVDVCQFTNGFTALSLTPKEAREIGKLLLDAGSRAAPG